MKFVPIWACLCCCVASLAFDRPTTSRNTASPDAGTDTAATAEMIPPACSWPRVFLSVTAGLFVMAAVIGPIVLAQSRGNPVSPHPQNDVPRPGRKSG
jgi:hypothetical protein